MDKDFATTVIGILTGSGIGLATFQAAPLGSKLWWTGMGLAVLTAAWGYLTNKRP